VNGEEIGVSDPSLGIINFKFRLIFSKKFAHEKVNSSN